MRDRVVSRYIVDLELQHLDEALFPEVRGHRKGGNPQLLVEEACWWAEGMPDAYVVVADIKECFEHIDPIGVVARLPSLGVSPWVVAWMRDFYRQQRGRFPGLVRGIGWSPLLASIHLLEFDRWARAAGLFYARSGDDLFWVTRTAEDASALFVEAKTRLKTVGLELHDDKKKWITGIRGRWDLLGFEFDEGAAHPPVEKMNELIASLSAADDEKRRRILTGWLEAYSLAVNSPRMTHLLGESARRWPYMAGRAFLDHAVVRARRRRERRRYAPALRKKAFVNQPAFPPCIPEKSLSGNPAAAVEVWTAEAEPNALRVRSLRRAGARVVPPPSGGVLELYLNPALAVTATEDLPRALPGQLRALVFRNGWAFISWASALSFIERERLYDRLGFASFDAFVRCWLAEDPRFIQRVIRLGLGSLHAHTLVRDFAKYRFTAGPMTWALAQHLGEPERAGEMLADLELELVPDHVPVGHLKAMALMSSDEPWSWHQRMTLVMAVAIGTCSVRAAKRSVDFSVHRALLQSGRVFPRPMWWGVVCADGVVRRHREFGF